MPELPEVETVVRGLRPLLIGHTITGAKLPAPPGRMMTISADDLAAKIAGQRINRIERRAKYILVRLSSDTLAIHLKMTGRLYVLPAAEVSENDRYLRITFPLDNDHEFRFSDPRRFGRVLFGSSPDAILPSLGPEPLDDSFTLDAFRERIKGRSGALKPLLLNQAFVAGIGNIYADESLHIAKLHPLRTADSLTDDEIVRLHDAIRQSLRDGVRYEGATLRWYRKADGTKGQSQEHFRVYHDPRTEKDKRCLVCGSSIAVIRVGQRGTHFCPVCQPPPAPLS